MVDIHITVTGPVTVSQIDTTPILNHLNSLEGTVATAAEAIAALTAQADENATALADLVADVHTLIGLLQAEPQLSAETQAAADALAAKLTGEHDAITAADTDVEAADGTPTP